MNKTKIIVFSAIVLTGLVISLFTLNMCGTPVEKAGNPDPVTTTTPESPEGTKSKSGKSDSDPANPKGKKGTAPTENPEVAKVDIFQSPEAIMGALSDKVKAHDFAAFETIVGANSIAAPERAQVKALIENEKYKVNADKPFVELSKSADSVRWALRLIPEGGGEAEEIYTDIKKKAEKSFSINKVTLPLDVKKLVASRGVSSPPATTPDGKPAAPGAAPAAAMSADAVTIAHAFSKAVIARDFETARALSDPSTVTDERVAALLIAMEEGEFALQEDRPLIVTLSRDDITWVLTRIQAGDQTSEFAQELGKVGTDWKVNGLTFSKVIASLANRAGAGSVAYAPIVEDPTGGDSLVLYFEFDAAGVTKRTRRQLAIVADILKQNDTRKLHINGHADAKGSDDYNSQLSDKRADSVRETLISLGVTPGQVITEAFGESRPRSPNFNADGTDNITGQSANRRAEVYLDF